MRSDEIEKILLGFRIPFRPEKRATNINCPFCVGRHSGRRDDRFRCGIFDNLRFHCWRCKRTGTLYDILHAIAGISRDAYASIIHGYSPKTENEEIGDIVRRKLAETKKRKSETLVLPELPTSWSVTPELCRQYPLLSRFLSDRRIKIETCMEYGSRYTGNVGEYAQRLIFPVDHQGMVVAWQGRDVSGKARAKYHSEGSIMDYLYWSAYCRPPYRFYLVEGVLDCWRMEYNSICCFSKALTRKQRSSLVGNPLIEELVICWDADAYDEALETARDLAPIVRRVGVVRLPEGKDPDDLGPNRVRELEVRWA